MLTVTLNEMDARAFVTAFNAIAEVADYSFDAETEYRLAIANLVGTLKEQLSPASRELAGVTPRCDLVALLTEKYLARDAECVAGAVCQSADDLLGEALERADYDRRQFSAGGNAGRAVAQLYAMLTATDAEAWNRYELALCAMTRQELAALKLSDLLGVLVVAEGSGKSGGSFWGRWKK
jgi:hypothetical protein